MTLRFFSIQTCATGLLPLAVLVFVTTSYLQSEEREESRSSDGSVSQEVALEISIEIPRLKVSEYHRPYVATWIEDDSSQLVQHLSVWYQQDTNEEGHGAKWLPDLRQWWRRGGRDLKMPVDGISGATRTVGKHSIKVPTKQFESLPPGKYTLAVEASREVGGREVVKLPLIWPASRFAETLDSGKTELGEVALKIYPPAEK